MKLIKKMVRVLLFVFIIFGSFSCGGETSTINGITINVLSNSGKKLEDVEVKLYQKNKLFMSSKTNEEGKVFFDTPLKKYDIKLDNIPSGYYLDQQYKTDTKTSTYDVVLYSKIIDGDRPQDAGNYSVGDVVYDHSFINTDGDELKLSSLLDDYKAIFINFFYIGCTWCEREFPFLQEGYELYNDKIAVIALSYQDTLDAMSAYKNYYKYTFNFCFDADMFTSYFSVTGFPTSILIDRYGVIRVFHDSAILAVDNFTEMFEKYTSDSYVPKEEGSEDGGDVIKPTVTMPESKDIEAAINGKDFTSSWYADPYEGTAEYSWPWVLSEDGKSIYPSNSKVNTSSAKIYTKVHLKANQVFVFDFLPSTEEYGDYLNVYVDGIIEFSISGVNVNWLTSYAFIASDEADYEIAFVYEKDDDTHTGNDKVLINNVRIINDSEITEEMYLRKHASYGYSETTKRYENKVDIFLNQNDGYYHVNSVNGPLLLLDMMGAYANHYTYVPIYQLISAGNFKLGNTDYTSRMEEYYVWAYNNDLGSTPVTEELKTILEEFTLYYYRNQNGNTDGYNNQWLDLCCYYVGYNKNGVELSDPIKGLSTMSSFEAKLGDQNFVNIERFTMPRGILCKFTPTESGVYKINSVSNNNVVAWIFLNDDRNNGLYFESTTAERYYSITDISDPNYIDNYSKNYNMYVYLEAGTSYYICSGFDDMYETGTIQFNIELLDDDFTYFRLCSFGPFTSENDDLTGDVIIGDGINYELGEDGYYHEKYSDGTLGSIIYCDFTYASYLNYSINYLIENNYFNFKYDQYEEQVGDGNDYTEVMKEYQKKIITENNITKGCVPVDTQLAQILQELMDIYTFDGVKGSWLKLCYYYKNVALSEGK